MAGCYPVSQGKMFNFAGGSLDSAKAGTVYDGPWVSTATEEELMRVFSHAEPAAQRIISVGVRHLAISPTRPHALCSASRSR